MDVHDATEGGSNQVGASVPEQQDPRRYASGRHDALKEAADGREDQIHGFNNVI